MKHTITLFLFLFISQIIFGQSEKHQIETVLIDYIEGTSNGEPARLEKAFHPDLNLYSVDKHENLKIWKGTDYIKVFKEGEKKDRTGRILSIDYENNAAIAKVEIKAYGRTYIDYFMLLKLKDGWKIIHKSYTQKKSITAGDTQSRITIDKAISEINNIANELVNQKKVAGFSYAIQKSNQNPKINHIGFADLDTKNKVISTHLFPIASVTKIFVSTAILKLIEENKLTLDTTIDSFFNNYPNGENITLYQLLTNTSGIKAWWQSEMPSDTPDNFPNCTSPHKYIERMNPSNDFEPGGYYNYSNTNFVLLAEIIEIASKKTFQAYLNDIIFKPLKLRQISNNLSVNKKQQVSGYEYDDDTLTKVEIESPFGAGSLFSNAEDLLTFMNALKSGKIISTDSFNKMITYGLLSNGNRANTTPYFNTSQSSELWKEYGYGMGMELVRFNGNLMYFHSGITTGGQAFLMHFPHNNTTFSMVINTQGRFLIELDKILLAINRIK